LNYFSYDEKASNMLQEVLHLVAWRGFVNDIGPAIASCRATWTDERIWYPFLIQQTYGPKQKTRLQILAEHTTQLLGGEKQHIVLKKDKLMLYRPEERWLARINQLDDMAKKAGHSTILETMLYIPDTDGKNVFSVACKNNCPKIVSYYFERGVDCNQRDNFGATPSYYAWNSKFGRQAWNMLPWCAEYKYPKPKETLPMWPLDIIHIVNPMLHHDIVANGVGIELINNSVPPKPKKLKSKLYKQQFGPKR
jgi:hypothetical protein